MSEKMRVIVTAGVKDIQVQEYDIPEIGPYDVLYKLKSTALCTVEQRTYSGAKNFGYPLVGGHETSGVVVAVGENVMEFEVGDNVISTLGYCGVCEFCKTGQGSACKNTTKGKPRFKFKGPIIGGGLAEYLAVPMWQIVKIPKDANYNHFALTEPLACCVQSITKAKVEFGDTVVVIGAGIMGLFHVRLAKLRGARVIVTEFSDERLQKALAYGADYGINSASEDAVARIKEITDGKGAEVVINAVANPKVWDSAIDMLSKYGRLVAYSSQDSKEKVGVDFGRLHSKEYEYIGTVSPTMKTNLQATKLIAYGLMDMDDLIEGIYNFEDAQAAFEKAIDPNSYRVIINMNQE